MVSLLSFLPQQATAQPTCRPCSCACQRCKRHRPINAAQGPCACLAVRRDGLCGPCVCRRTWQLGIFGCNMFRCVSHGCLCGVDAWVCAGLGTTQRQQPGGQTRLWARPVAATNSVLLQRCVRLRGGAPQPCGERSAHQKRCPSGHGACTSCSANPRVSCSPRFTSKQVSSTIYRVTSTSPTSTYSFTGLRRPRGIQHMPVPACPHATAAQHLTCLVQPRHAALPSA